MKKTTVGRRTLAFATVVAAAVSLSACSILNQVTGGITEAVDPDSGTTQGIFTLVVGDCEVGNTDSTEVSTTKTIDCAEPHDAEIYGASYLPDGEFPGDAAIEEQATNDCLAQFESFLGINYDDSVYNFSWYYPTEGSWSDGDREILCLVYDPTGAQISGSLAGAAR